MCGSRDGGTRQWTEERRKRGVALDLARKTGMHRIIAVNADLEGATIDGV